MKKCIASTPNAEVSGESILGYIHSVEYAQIEPIFLSYGLRDIQSSAWYPHQTMLNVLRDIESRKSNVTESLVSIGVKVMEMATVPESINSIEAILESLGVVYHFHHRNVTETGWSAQSLEPGHMQVIHDSPYPEDLAYGIVWGAVKRFRPARTTFTVTSQKGTSDDMPTIYNVQWGH